MSRSIMVSHDTLMDYPETVFGPLIKCSSLLLWRVEKVNLVSCVRTTGGQKNLKSMGTVDSSVLDPDPLGSLLRLGFPDSNFFFTDPNLDPDPAYSSE